MRINILSKVRVTLKETTDWLLGLLQSTKFKELAKNSPEAFTRNRKLDVVTLTTYLINLVKSSTQVSIAEFMDHVKVKSTEISQQAVSKARQKLNWRACQMLADSLTEYIYSFGYKTWHNYRVLAIDGTKIRLPRNSKLRGFFGTFGKTTSPTGQGSILYDILNRVIVHGIIEPISTGERTLAKVHMSFLSKMKSFFKELIIFDRGYPSFEMFEYCNNLGITFLMRVKSNFNNAIKDLPLGCHKIILFNAGKEIIVRVIKFTLPKGEVETLVTNLFDYNLGVRAFQKLYFMRWPVETEYNFLKNRLEIENFSCLSVNGILQDFYITLLVANIITIASYDADSLNENKDNSNKNTHEYKINFNSAVGYYKNRFIAALLEENEEIKLQKINHIIYLISKSLTTIRPNRSTDRINKSSTAKFKFNQKSNC
jgi:hypothetical protein